MYTDDLILLSDTPERLQKHIDKLSKYCDHWKLNINLKKTKMMIFNRGNNLIKSEFKIKGSLECQNNEISRFYNNFKKKTVGFYGHWMI